MKKILSVLLAAAMVVSLAACGSKTAATQETTAAPAATQAAQATQAAAASDAAASGTAVDKVVIGCVGSITGVNSESGRQATQAAGVCEWYINEVLGGFECFGGAPIEIRMIDSTSDVATASLPFEQALSSGEICAVAGSAQSGVVLTQLPILQKYKIPAVTASASNGTITEQGCEYIFQPAPKTSFFGTQKLKFLEYYADLKGVKLEDLKYGIIYENSAWGSDTGTSNRNLIESAGLQANLVFDENYDAGTLTDATSLVTKMKNAGVDILFPGCYANDSKLIMTACAAMNYMPIIFGDGSAFTWPSLYEAIGDMANGVISADGFVADSKSATSNPEWIKINDKYNEMYNEFIPGQAGPMIASIMMIYQAIEELGSTDSVAITNKLRTFNNDNCQWFHVWGGDNSFDETGANMGTHAIMLQWQNGKPTCVFPLEDAASEVLDPLTLEPLKK